MLNATIKKNEAAKAKMTEIEAEARTSGTSGAALVSNPYNVDVKSIRAFLLKERINNNNIEKILNLFYQIPKDLILWKEDEKLEIPDCVIISLIKKSIQFKKIHSMNFKNLLNFYIYECAKLTNSLKKFIKKIDEFYNVDYKKFLLDILSDLLLCKDCNVSTDKIRSILDNVKKIKFIDDILLIEFLYEILSTFIIASNTGYCASNFSTEKMQNNKGRLKQGMSRS